FHPYAYMYYNEGDGLKNYFTLVSYISQPAYDGMLHYTAMQYPFGDYIYFTDNSPLIAFLMRLFSLYVVDISDQAIFIIHCIVFLNVLIAPVVIWKILRKFTDNGWILVAGCLLLSWISPQFLRIFGGTYNLSFSIFFFLAILFAIQITEAVNEKNRRKFIKNYIWLLVLIIAASFIHLYYIVLLAIPLAAFFTFYSLVYLKQIKYKTTGALSGLFSIFFCIFCVLLIIRTTDAYSELRLDVPEGRNLAEWETNYYTLFKSDIEVNTLSFFGGKMEHNLESTCFLGNFFLYGVSILLIYIIYLRFKKHRNFNFSKSDQKILILFLVSGLISYFSSCGDSVLVFNLFKVENIFNPLHYIKRIYPPTEHFRFTGRINIWFYYSFQFMFLIIAAKGINFIRRENIKQAVYITFSCILLVEIGDNVKAVRTAVDPNFFNEAALSEIPEVKADEFQAILPIPFYHVGSENYDYTIDEYNSWGRYSFQLQLKTGLPLISSKLSRTPPLFAQHSFSIFLNKSPDQALLDKMNGKPVLVIYNSKVVHHSDRFPASEVIETGPDIIERYNMEYLFSDKNVSYYKWNVR
ncbi:MAG: hypothetical protein ACHQFW_08370, partial [Chitinophagales bacterium]